MKSKSPKVLSAGLFGALLFLSGCAGDDAEAVRCPVPYVNESWIPTVAGMDPSNHDPTVEVIQDVYTRKNIPLTGLAEGYSPSGSHVVTVSIDMSEDLLSNGSISLVAEVTDFPDDDLVGSAWPVLISLNDGANELVNLTGCESEGFFDCSDGTCSALAGCAPAEPSAFIGSSAASRRDKWDQHQSIGSVGDPSVNTFPSCNWSGETPSCPFNDVPFFDTGDKLRSGAGVTYTAKYVLLASNYSYVGGYRADFKLTVIRKKDDTAMNGAMDVNVVMVGADNILASQTAKGQQNLNALFQHVQDQYSVANPGVSLGSINVYNWDCEGYADVHLDSISDMFAEGSSGLPSSGNAKSLNVFLVNGIEYGGPGTIMGLAGSIVGSMVNGTGSSGVAVATLADLAGMNPDCLGSGTCAISEQEEPFINMGGTISHEMGHFLGLNHLSEGNGALHDWLPDTPECNLVEAIGSDPDDWRITIQSCLQETACDVACPNYSSGYCPTASECQFNHVMWWTTKNYNSSGDGDGSLFSAQSSALINYNPYVQ